MNSWGECGNIRKTDMWNKQTKFTAWLGEVKQVKLESLLSWEEKPMFKSSWRMIVLLPSL